MDKSVVGLIGAVGALIAASPSQAAPVAPATIDAALQASSYADLLSPIPNASAILKASAAVKPPVTEGAVEDVQLYLNFGPPRREYYRHHHHHHHHHWSYHHHHHHHRWDRW